MAEGTNLMGLNGYHQGYGTCMPYCLPFLSFRLFPFTTLPLYSEDQLNKKYTQYVLFLKVPLHRDQNKVEMKF